LSKVVIAAAGDGGDDAQQFGLAFSLGFGAQVGGQRLGRHFAHNVAGVRHHAGFQQRRDTRGAVAVGQHADDAVAAVQGSEGFNFPLHPGTFQSLRGTDDDKRTRLGKCLLDAFGQGGGGREFVLVPKALAEMPRI
jgi:hypothetical protein